MHDNTRDGKKERKKEERKTDTCTPLSKKIGNKTLIFELVPISMRLV